MGIHSGARVLAGFGPHAARIPLARNYPITIVLSIRNEEWLADYGHLPGNKRCLGFLA